ncbi:MAG TPA: DUF1013 domain-containing protein [Alphaproteobacteria bacterium]|nr:DUF1013 domain-containing protein [Alphaproteobacteria bacterium]
MAHPLMPKAAAVWLIENTTLTFDQIAEFSGLHSLEVQAIADDEVAVGMQGLDPVAAGELTVEEIERCQADPDGRLVMATPDIPRPQARTKGARYTPVSKRQNRPDAIAWLVKTHPELTDGQISKLVGTTKPTINAIRERTHWNISNIKPQNPVGLGMCSAIDLGQAVEKARARIANAEKRRLREERKAAGKAAEKTPKIQEALPAPESLDALAAPEPREALTGPPAAELITDQSQKPKPDQG